MRKYVVGYYNKAATKEDFVILTTMDSFAVGMFVRDSYNKTYKEVGMTTNAVLLEKCEVPNNYSFAD